MASPAPTPAPAVAERAGGAGAAPRSRHRLRAIVVVDVVILAAAVVALAITDPFARAPSKGVTDNAYPTSLKTVTRQDLYDQNQVSATLGYAGSYTVVNRAQGTITSLPSTGQVVTEGHVLYEVNGQPVVLLYGSTPMYRSLSEGALASDVTGPDVQELNADLVALGYATRAELNPASDEFTWRTKIGVEDLQAALGVSQTGTLALDQVVFLPTSARISAISATLGAPVGPGQSVMSATSNARQVSIPLDADQQSQVAVGDHVTITLPDNQNTPGVISSVGTVAVAPAAGSSGSSATITVLVNPTDPAATGTWDQAPVQVSITTGSVSNALVVPVDALLAQADGGYAVEVVGADGIHRLVPVSTGLFDDADGLVQVTGSGLAVGQRVVVPAL
jgi:hypothetical protein